MRTETYNAVRDYSQTTISWTNTRLATWASDPVGLGATLTAEFSDYHNETVEFLKHSMRDIQVHTDIIAKLDELHGE